MDKLQSVISHNFNTIIETKEEYLPYIKACCLVKPMSGDSLVTKGLEYLGTGDLPPEFSNSSISLAFKKISKEDYPEKYQIYLNINLYSETDKKSTYFYGNPVNLMVLVAYINSRGKYEVKKYNL